MDPLDDLDLLRTFVRIAECGGISSAARAMGFNQPTVSRRLRQLERSAGVDLIRRDTRTMSLTSAGRQLLEDARGLLEMAEAAHQRIRGDRDAIRGHLRIVAVVDFGQWIVARLLAEFRSIHPGVTAELHFVNRPVRFIEEGFDCGILVGDAIDPMVTSRMLAPLERCLVASPSFLESIPTPKRPADLGELPWLGIVQPQFYARDRLTLRRGKQEIAISLKPVLLFDGVTAAREAMLAGGGIAMQPMWLIRDDLRAGRVAPVLRDWEVAPIPAQIVYPAARVHPARVRVFVDFVQRRVADLM
ncbi:MAG: LysR family transcriptional regulator [Verrucomicrobiales bacterium]|nr:LysR family transcriptional regulator [Verrucomicrobiales bacterium]